jgi:hypothetical protein
MTTPTLALTGDEDWPCLQPAQNIPTAALSVMPNCGHTINIEAPDQFNRLVVDFIVQVDAGRRSKRYPRAIAPVVRSPPRPFHFQYGSPDKFDAQCERP